MIVKVIGGGLAGCEAAWQLAKRGIHVKLYDMKPHKFSPAHNLPSLCELVCSNSLRSDMLENAVGLLKQEMRELGSLVMECADATRLPAGGALAVDRVGFSKLVTAKVAEHENIEIVNEEIESIDPDEYTIVASGPLTSDSLYESIREFLGDKYLHFFDAAAPIVTTESIDMTKAYRASRYGRGTDDYINCPMTEDEYNAFYEELINAELAEVHGADNKTVFEGCMPVETMAKRGKDTLLFGPLKPVGLENPKDGTLPHAVVQLRQDNKDGTLYNIVGFQTHLKFGEQKRVFSMIPGLENAEFVRYGVMHRNTFINSPQLLNKYYQVINSPKTFFAGQITGVEGYVESASSGMAAGINMAKMLLGEDMVDFTRLTATGGLAHYISEGSTGDFQPMNVTFGIIDPLEKRVRKKREKNALISQRALEKIEEIKKQL
ncbi:MAG: methylenetetrahydrofolate--tRNA-(uracil(54)-C(5))-methyltransferase (FADH(2)-oxidizing) TrmFO [Clostridia bacterium]|nr:methylenetetrahydrofolate--tRNA-(uracil(54)-C(5))-methyltransferase (FADH(2)-oxidizing) TrmFO [Clostridia bacterium]